MKSSSKSRYWLGFDLGGTKMMATLFDKDFNIVAYRRKKTKDANGAKGILARVVETVEEAITALPLVIALDRKKVRQRFVQRFSATRMASDYLGLYRSLVNLPRSLAGEARHTQHRSVDSKHANYPKLHAV